MDVVRRMFAKQTARKSKKHNASTSTPSEMCEPPRASTGGGGSVGRRRESPITPARASAVKTSRNFNDQYEIGEISSNLQVIDDDTGRRTIKQYNRIANYVPTYIADYNLHGNIYFLRGNLGGPSRVYHDVITKYPEVKRIFNQPLWQLKMPKSDHKIVGSIIQRWSNKTHTFHLLMVEVGITLFDFTFVTGK